MKHLIIFLLILTTSHSKSGFRKDLKMDIEFPPDILPPSHGSSIPIGHLRPLGWQRRTDGPIFETEGFMKPEDFYNDYVSKNTTVVFRNGLKNVPAMEKWDVDDYLRKQFGNLHIHVVVKKELAKLGPKKVTINKFLKEYEYEDWYLSNIVPQEMMIELSLPQVLRCGFTKYLQESEIWMSSGGTSSLIHSHADHNLHCLLFGRKDFIVIDPKYKDLLKYKTKHPYPGAGHSELDPDMINMFKNKQVQKVPWTWATLKGGDCVYVPAGFLHQVRSFGRSISSTILFAPVKHLVFSETDCNRAQLNDFVPLTDATFIWTNIDGDKQLSNSKLNAFSMKHHLMVLMRNADQLEYDIFADFYNEIMSEMKDKSVHYDVNQAWNLLCKGEKKTFITREEIENMDSEILSKLAVILNAPHMIGRDDL